MAQYLSRNSLSPTPVQVLSMVSMTRLQSMFETVSMVTRRRLPRENLPAISIADPAFQRNGVGCSFVRRALVMELVVLSVEQPLGHWPNCSITSGLRNPEPASPKRAVSR
jgi:hypothetical protein